ncbi:MAG: phosphatase PAP2 family protein, partial [Oscillospiraceae bacterium]|nr:phosphatase PAP2 family protein [Oscillospiraceae bacterium]
RRKAYLRNLLFAFAVVWLVVLGYNRIHMNAHFLTDVCFGVLITYCLYLGSFLLFCPPTYSPSLPFQYMSTCL